MMYYLQLLQKLKKKNAANGSDAARFYDEMERCKDGIKRISKKGILSEFLENKKIPISDLAKDTDQNRQSIYYQLQGKRAITYETAQRYAEKLNVDEADFFIPKNYKCLGIR